MNAENWPDYRPVGDAALVVEFGEAIDPSINQQVQAFAQRLEAARLTGITDIVPTYRSVLVHYDPVPLSYDEVTTWARAQVHTAGLPVSARRNRIEIPVAYGGEFGPDLDFVARWHHLSPKDIIRLHSTHVRFLRQLFKMSTKSAPWGTT